MDLVMRLLDDIDTGRTIEPARTAHLREKLLRTEGARAIALKIQAPQQLSKYDILWK